MQMQRKSVRFVLVTVMISFSIILFQNCGKKIGLASVLSDASTSTEEPMNNKAIEIKIHTGPGLNSPEVSGDLDPEETYYLQVRNVSLNGYACIELADSDGACLREPEASGLIDQKNWHNIGETGIIEQEFVPGSFGFAESINLYMKESIGDVPTKQMFRIKSPAEMTNPKGVYIWHSLDPEGKNRIRHMSSAGVNGVIKYYSHAINIGFDADKIEICQDILGPSISTPSCVDADGNKVVSGPWNKRPLLKSSDAEGFFQSKQPTPSADGSVFRYFNVDSAQDVSANVTCIKTYFFKDGVTYLFPLGFNEGTSMISQSCGGGNPRPTAPPASVEYIVPKNCNIKPITWPSGGLNLATTPLQHLPRGQMVAFRTKVPEGRPLVRSGTGYADVPKYMSISTNPCDFSESLKLSRCMTGAKTNDPIIWNTTQNDPGYCQLPPAGTTIYFSLKNSDTPTGPDTCIPGADCKFYFYW